MFSDRTEELLPCLPPSVRRAIASLPWTVREGIAEIRLRADRPASLTIGGESRFFDSSGALCANVPERPLTVCAAEVEETVFRLCGGSVYSHENELTEGFISLKGGHRAGVCGTGVFTSGRLSALRDVTSVNVRIARAVRGCSEAICARDVSGGLLIAGAPGSGKTTVLNDLLRRLSDGSLGRVFRVCAVDERGELTPAPDADTRAGFDVMRGIKKEQAVNMLIRSMSPQIIVLDEISTPAEVAAVRRGIARGVEFIMTAHAADTADLLRDPVASKLLGMCKTVALLGRVPGESITVLGSKEIKNAGIGNRASFAGDLVVRRD